MIVLPAIRAAFKPASAAAFSLADYSGRVAHYDIGQLPVLSDGAEVGGTQTLTDLSGNARHLSHATASYRPKYYSNQLNGRPILRFAAASTQRIYTTDAGMPTGAFSLLYVYKPVTDYTNGVYSWLGGWGKSTWNSEIVPYIGGVTSYGGNSLWGATQYGDSGPDWGSWTANSKSCYNAWNVLLLTRTGNTWDFYKSTTTSKRTRTMTTAPVLNGEFILGGWPLASGYMNGDLAEHCIWNRVLTGSEISAIMTGLGAKYGITINT